MFRFYSLLIALLKLDFVFNVFFIASSVFFKYDDSVVVLYYCWIDIAIFLLVTWNFYRTLDAIINADSENIRKFLIMRGVIEVFKLL